MELQTSRPTATVQELNLLCPAPAKDHRSPATCHPTRVPSEIAEALADLVVRKWRRLGPEVELIASNELHRRPRQSPTNVAEQRERVARRHSKAPRPRLPHLGPVGQEPLKERH